MTHFLEIFIQLIVIGADEKVLRIFDASKLFLESLNAISDIPLPEDDSEVTERDVAAYMPELGLSNKGIKTNGADDKESGFAVDTTTIVVPPLEERLMEGTLWPEVNKLYGHGNNIMSITSNNDRTIIASVCKARTEIQAKIRLWDGITFKALGELEGHTSTVVQLGFSSDDKYLISVSKDRSMCMYMKVRFYA